MAGRSEASGRAAPLRAGLPGVLLESSLGYGALMLGARITGALQNGPDSALAVAFTALGLLWLAFWPAWRLQPVESGHWWTRLAAGIIRAVFTGVLLALIGWLLAALLSPSAFDLLRRGATAIVAPGFLIFRVMVLVGAAATRPVQRRLRWQLMASHVGVIVLVLITLTSTGSVIGLILLERDINPNPAAMAASVADDLRLGRSVQPFNRTEADQVLRQIEAKRLPLRGEPALAGFAPAPLLPDSIALITPDGRVLTAIRPFGDRRKVDILQGAAGWWAVFGPSRAAWTRLRQLALKGRAGSMLSPPLPEGQSRSDVLAEAPLRGPAGRITAVVILRTANQIPSSRQLVQAFVALFGVSTVALILVISLPMLGLSFVFSYLLARGLTRHLESVSRVARSIASGNLSERAPVTSQSEVGRLAEDINRMAERLGATMGELQKARLQAERALHTRQELVANVSHELRTPLAVLRAHLETLLMRHPASVGPAVHPEQAEIPVPAATIHALQSETERLAALVDDLFALSRAEGGAIEVRREPVDVAAVVDEIATVMRPLAQQDGMVTLSVEARPGLPPAMADPDRLRQILSNLVRNAVRHTPEGGIVILAVTADDPWIVVSVADTGEGIAPEHLPHIFERFYRVDEARAQGSGGAGLGLAIVHEFVELMGGQIEVESEPGEGTCFRVFLPHADPVAARRGGVLQPEL